MTSSNSNQPLIQLAKSSLKFKWIWIATTLACGVLGVLYIFLCKNEMWRASQALIIRDEALGADMRLGRFESSDAMRAAQETVVELSRNQQVLAEAIKTVGLPKSGSQATDGVVPTKLVEELQGQVKLLAPNGAELGTSEVLYLEVIQDSPDRALELNKAICDCVERRMNLVRQERAQSVIDELSSAKEAAIASLATATNRLQAIEAEAGEDLSDLLGLTDFAASGSATRSTLDRVNDALQLVANEILQISADLETAKDSFEDPDQLLRTPTKLVNAHPGLRRLREGLAAASINASQLSAKFLDDHPLVIAARETQERIRTELRIELGSSVKTLTKELEIAQAKQSKLKEQKNTLESRIGKLAGIRANYGNVAREVDARNAQLQGAEKELAAAVAARQAAESTSLLTRIDAPVLGDRPVGPGNTTILAGSGFCGLLIGFGVIFLLTPLDSNVNYGRREQDFRNPPRRRASDQAAARDKSDSDNKSAEELKTSVENSSPSLQADVAKQRKTESREEQKTQFPETGKLPGSNPEEAPTTTPSQSIVGAAKESSDTLTNSDQPREADPEGNATMKKAEAVLAAAIEANFADQANAPPRPLQN